MLVDLTATFDSIDQNILIDSINVFDSCSFLQWFKTYVWQSCSVCICCHREISSDNLVLIFTAMPMIPNCTSYPLNSSVLLINCFSVLITQTDTERLTHSFFMSSYDYCSVLLSGPSKKAIHKLQIVQNAAAHKLTKTRMRAHIPPVIKSLYRLPVHFRKYFGVLLLVFKSLWTSFYVHLRHAFY